MSHSLKDQLLFLRSLLFPIQYTPVTGVFPKIYLGYPIGYSLPPIGFVRTIASGTVALGLLQKSPAFLRTLSRLRLRALTVFYREMRYIIAFSFNMLC